MSVNTLDVKYRVPPLYLFNLKDTDFSNSRSSLPLRVDSHPKVLTKKSAQTKTVKLGIMST